MWICELIISVDTLPDKIPVSTENNHLQTSSLHAEEWQVRLKLVTYGASLKNVAVSLHFAGIQRGFA